MVFWGVIQFNIVSRVFLDYRQGVMGRYAILGGL